MHFSERLKRFIAENELFYPDDRLLLAVSGGKDSVLLTQLTAELGYRFAIAHCNFQLRGAESDADEAFVEALASTHKAAFHSIRFETAKYAKEHRISIQMAARELRYAWLEEIRAAGGYQYIAVAHHQTDSVETIFLNMLRGTGISGLSGIAPKRARIVRPLLAFCGREVADEVQRRGLPYREDASNASTKYTRNAIRLEVLPVLRKINPELEKTMLANAGRFSQVAEFLQREVGRLREQLFLPASSGEVRIPLPALQKVEPRELMIYELFKPFGFTEAVLSDLIREWDGLAGKQFYSASHLLLLNRSELILKPLSGLAEKSFNLSEFPASFQWYGHSYSGLLTDAPASMPRTGDQVLDFDLLHFPLTVRSWQEGDSFQPLGMRGRKKVSDFLIGCKVPRSAKAEVPLIADAEGRIVAILPWRIDDRFKVTQETKKVLIFGKTSHG